MVKSDLVTYGGGTERYLFFSVAFAITCSVYTVDGRVHIYTVNSE